MYFEYAEKCAAIIRKHDWDVSDPRIWRVM
jgi:hypothetical protein